MFRLGCAALLGLAAVVLAGGAVEAGLPSGVRSGLLRATDLLLNRSLEAAEAECGKLLAGADGRGPGRFCQAMVSLARAEDRDEPARELDRFAAQMAEAVAALEQAERRDPADAELQLLLGLAQGSQALAGVERGRYLGAVRGIREAHRRFREALRLNPALADAYYGLGLYEYGLGRLPSLLRPLANLMLPAGDPAAGLRHLERAAVGGEALRAAAQVALLMLYAGPERRPAEALRLGRGLLRRYPDNAELYFATALAASELGLAGEALEIARRIGRQIAEKRPGFPPELAGRQFQLLGLIHMDQGNHTAALDDFRRAIAAPTPARYRWATAWAWTRSGMIHDLRGERAEAIRCYRQATAAETGSLAAKMARRYLDTPFARRPRAG